MDKGAENPDDSQRANRRTKAERGNPVKIAPSEAQIKPS